MYYLRGMKRKTWKTHHKWLGLLLTLFLILFCLSGIVLNHRHAWRRVSVSRGWLPSDFQYRQWNRGLLRGEVRSGPKDGDGLRLLYGSSGIWRIGADGSVSDFNRGLPKGADLRGIRSVVCTPEGLYAASQFGLYRLGEVQLWSYVPLPLGEEERLSDLTLHGDTLVATGRSALYYSTPPYASFTRLTPQAPRGYRSEETLFRTVWLLHSGELFGLAGRLIMDGVALILILLSLTGLLYWWLPKRIRRRSRKRRNSHTSALWLRRSFNWHSRLVRWTIMLTLLIALTGMSLRPPLLIALVKVSVPTIPGTTLHSQNPWRDKLRLLRYDARMGQWLLSTSRGFYALDSLRGVPEKITLAPPVSPMGVNAWVRTDSTTWVVGSFSGAYNWQPQEGVVLDYLTGEPAKMQNGAPFGRFAVQGYAYGAKGEVVLVGYDSGYEGVHMPSWMATLPMSLWRLALEVHTGRIFTVLGIWSIIFPFLMGLLIAWILWSGYRLTQRRRGRRLQAKP